MIIYYFFYSVILPARPQQMRGRLRIKWPNDLYADGLKLGGILCQSSFCVDTFDLLIGMMDDGVVAGRRSWKERKRE